MSRLGNACKLRDQRNGKLVNLARRLEAALQWTLSSVILHCYLSRIFEEIVRVMNITYIRISSCCPNNRSQCESSVGCATYAIPRALGRYM